jgi:repressor LexA
MKTLTPRQKGVYDFLKEYVSEKGYAPSYREIQSHFSFSSLGSVHKYLTVLKQKGYIESEKQRSRSLTLVEENTQSKSIELDQSSHAEVSLMGYLSVGSPIETFAQMKNLEFPESVVPHPERSYILQVRGEGLTHSHIMDGDLLVIEPGEEPVDGDVIVGETPALKTFLRRFSAAGSRVCLSALYEGESPLYLYKSELTIFGIVVSTIRSLRGESYHHHHHH